MTLFQNCILLGREGVYATKLVRLSYACTMLSNNLCSSHVHRRTVCMYQPFRYLFMYVVVGVFLFLASEIRAYYYIILNNSVQLKVGRPAKLRSYSACLS